MYHLPVISRQQRDGHGDHPLPSASLRGSFYPHKSFRPHHRTWQERLTLLVYSDEVLVVVSIAVLAATVIGFIWLAVWAVSTLRHIGGS